MTGSSDANEALVAKLVRERALMKRFKEVEDFLENQLSEADIDAALEVFNALNYDESTRANIDTLIEGGEHSFSDTQKNFLRMHASAEEHGRAWYDTERKIKKLNPDFDCLRDPDIKRRVRDMLHTSEIDGIVDEAGGKLGIMSNQVEGLARPTVDASGLTPKAAGAAAEGLGEVGEAAQKSKSFLGKYGIPIAAGAAVVAAGGYALHEMNKRFEAEGKPKQL